MEARELRIGNFICYSLDTVEHHQTILGLLTDGVDTGFRKLLSYNQILPIPLTEEWLLRFGFEHIDYLGDSNRYEKDEFYLGCNNNGFYLQFETLICSRYIKFVHELQNLYYALTGTELEIKATASV